MAIDYSPLALLFFNFNGSSLMSVVSREGEAPAEPSVSRPRRIETKYRNL